MLSFPTGTALTADVKGPTGQTGGSTEPVPARQESSARSGEAGFLDVLAALAAAAMPPATVRSDDPAAPATAADAAPTEGAPPDEAHLAEGETETEGAQDDRMPSTRAQGAALGVPTAGKAALLPEGAPREPTPGRAGAGGDAGRKPVFPGPAPAGAAGPLVPAGGAETPANASVPMTAGDAGGPEQFPRVAPTGPDRPGSGDPVRVRAATGLPDGPDGPVPAARGGHLPEIGDGAPARGGARNPPPTEADPPRPGVSAPPNGAFPAGGEKSAAMAQDRPTRDPATGLRRAPDRALAPTGAAGDTEQTGGRPTAAPGRAVAPPVAAPVVPVAGDESTADGPNDPSPGPMADAGRTPHNPTVPPPAPPAPPAPSATARAIAHQIATAVQDNGAGSFEIRLNPEELGKLRIVLRPGDAGLAVSIQADRPETLDLLRRHADSLAQDFRAMGYQSTAFSFGPGGGGRDRGSAGQTTGAHGPLAGDPAATREDDPVLPARDAAPLPPGRMDVRL